MSDHPPASDDAVVPQWAWAVVRARVPLLVVLALCTALAGMSATRLAFNFSPDNLFVSDDPELDFFLKTVTPAFGDAGRTCILAIEGDLTIFGVQQAVVDATTRLARVKGVGDVTSIATVEVMREGALGFMPLFDANGHADTDALKRAARDPNLGGILLSETLDVTAILAPLNVRDEHTVATIVALGEDIARQYPSINVHLAGVPVSHEVIVSTLKRDQVKFIPIVILVMGLLLFVSFRDVRGVVLPFVATGCAAVWCVGAMAAAGHAINVVNNAIVVLLLVVGIADGVHLVERFLDELEKERARCGRDDVDRDRVIAMTIAAMTLPCLLTTATTSVGFLGALVAQMHLVQEFGLDAALGVLGAFVATMIVVPSLLGVIPLPAPRQRARSAARPLAFVDAGLAKATALALRHPLALVLAFLVAAGGLGILASKVRANQTLLSELPEDSPSRHALALLEDKLAGVLPVEIIYSADDVATLTSWAVLHHMAALKEQLERGDVGRTALAEKHLEPIVTRVRSLTDVYASVAQSLGGDVAAKAPSLWSDDDIAQLKLIFELAPDENQAAATAGLLAKDARLARLILLVPDAGSERFIPFLAALKEATLPAPEGVTVHVSGGQVVATTALQTVSADMMSSVGLAFVLIFIFVSLLFRSLLIGALALLPNALPVLATLAAMGTLAVPLRLATVLTFCMALGVAVDACIHILARLREELGHTGDLSDAISRTMIGAGRPVVISTALLLGGFLVLGFSEFGGLRDFAILSAATLTCALIVDVMLLPALIKLVRPKFRRAA